jgi:hypothetical protein
MDRYAGWLHEQHYTWRSARYELRMAGRVADFLKGRAVCRIEDLNHQHLDECHSWFRKKFPEEAGGVIVLMRFLHRSGHFEEPPPSLPSNPVDVHVSAFMAHLGEVRGYAPATIRRQGQIAAEFLMWLQFLNLNNPNRLSSLTINDLEGFIQHLSERMGRVSLQKPIAIIRNFLRFLASNGSVPVGLDVMIEAARVSPGAASTIFALANRGGISVFNRQEIQHGEARLRHVRADDNLWFACLRCRGSYPQRHRLRKANLLWAGQPANSHVAFPAILETA